MAKTLGTQAPDLHQANLDTANASLPISTSGEITPNLDTPRTFTLQTDDPYWHFNQTVEGGSQRLAQVVLPGQGEFSPLDGLPLPESSPYFSQVGVTQVIGNPSFNTSTFTYSATVVTYLVIPDVQRDLIPVLTGRNPQKFCDVFGVCDPTSQVINPTTNLMTYFRIKTRKVLGLPILTISGFSLEISHSVTWGTPKGGSKPMIIRWKADWKNGLKQPSSYNGQQVKHKGKDAMIMDDNYGSWVGELVYPLTSPPLYKVTRTVTFSLDESTMPTGWAPAIKGTPGGFKSATMEDVRSLIRSLAKTLYSSLPS